MPSMFSRRRGTSAQRQPVDQHTSSAATAAAQLAAIGRPQSQGNLSASAAAAALRSNTTSPVNVGAIQTKRMARRGSTSSVGSGSVVGSGMRGGPGRAGLQRMNSGGSMTERTFRSPSPGRGMNGAVSPDPEAPPVPILPQSVRGGHQRASSLDPPQRVMSPQPRGGRHASADRASMPPPASDRKSKRLSNVPELVRENSGDARNFSRPIASPGNSANNSPATNKQVHGKGGWFTQPTGDANTPIKGSSRPKTSDGISAYDTSRLQQDVQNAANQPVRTKKSSTYEGSHLAQATQQSAPQEYMIAYDASSRSFVRKPKPREAESEPSSPVMAYDPNSRKVLPAAELKAAEAASAKAVQPGAVQPGAYDPHTRSIAPGQEVMSDSDITKPRSKKKCPAVPTVDTSLEPPPRNPARLSPTSPPQSPRVTGLHKQPSVVREDREAEAAAEESSPPPATNNLQSTNRMIQTSAGPAKMYVAPSSHQRAASLDVPRLPESAARGRNASLSISPSRSAHFSASPIIEAQRHQPPARGISPVKSAMKSPASSIRTASPMATFSPNGPKAPPSETSDTTSLASQDGVQPRKKKSVRVSFEEQPRDLAATASTSASKAAMRERSPAVQDEMDEIMRPRPALPSFGSVRGKRPGVQQDMMAEKVTEHPPERGTSVDRQPEAQSSDHAIGGILANAPGTWANKMRGSNEPLPPDTTSKEGTGYVSDESDDAFEPATGGLHKQAETERQQTQGPVASQAPKIKDFAETKNEHQENADVPAISLQPPTPGIDEESKQIGDEADQVHEEPAVESRRSMERFDMPGGWGRDSPVKQSEAEKHHPTDPTPAMSGISEPSPAGEPTNFETGTLPRVSEHSHTGLSDIDEDSDDSAAFSDAAEDLSDLEDGGFASLDAIVSSPVISPASAAAKKSDETPPDSPSVKAAAKNAAKADAFQSTTGHVPQTSSDWSHATAYWSKLSRQQRDQIERDHLSSDDEARPLPAANKKPRKKKPAQRQVAVESPTEESFQPPPPRQQQRITQPAQPAMKKSMRAQPGPAPAPTQDGEVHMRKSMRSGAAGGGGMRGSMRDGPRPQSEYISPPEPRGALQKRNIRPSSAGGLPTGAAGAAMTHQRQQSAQSQQSQDGAFPRLKAAQSPPSTNKLLKGATKDDSDSESSFKKKRRPSASNMDSQGRYNMRRSMRAGSIDSVPPMPEQRPTSPTPAGRGKGSLSIRSLSPTGSFFGRKKAGENLRESMRGNSMDAGARTLRGPQSMRPQSIKGFGSSKPAPAPAPTKSRFKSRFADSDDEDEDDRPKRGLFRSRFADSDDDEPGSPAMIPADLTPVRGIPKRKGQDDGDSTDLSDEEDDDPRKASRRRSKQKAPLVPDPADVEKAMAAARRNLGIEEKPAAPAAANREGESDALQKGSLRQAAEQQRPETVSRPSETPSQPEKKKRGFMGSILRRNRSSQQGVPQVVSGSPAQAPASPQVAQSPQAPPAHQQDQQPPASPSTPSKGKLVRRSSAQPRQTTGRGDSTTNLNAPTTSSPLARKESDSWPLPAPPKVTANGVERSSFERNRSQERPNTSDGVPGPSSEAIKLARTMRPDLLPRSESNMTDGIKQGEIYSAKTGKKKKFGRLRKAFGLND